MLPENPTAVRWPQNSGKVQASKCLADFKWGCGYCPVHEAAARLWACVSFNRYFYKYVPPRRLKEIEADIQVIEKDMLAMLREVAG